MKIIIAPNAFKGSLDASLAAEHIARGLRDSGLAAELSVFPVADGGDGTLPLLVERLGAETVFRTVADPLGRPVRASFGWSPASRTALVALSEASGLRLLSTEERDPLKANTFGTGELMAAALALGARRLLIGVGGSATVDGGTGIARALGIRFFGAGGEELDQLPAGLERLERFTTDHQVAGLASCDITVLSDVENKLLGPRGAAAVFGPQKGADSEDVAQLERCLGQLDAVVYRQTGLRMGSLLFGGAAGGVAAGLAAFGRAELVSGTDFFLDHFGFDALVDEADLVITGEGSIDAQTAGGKAPFGVARRCRAKAVPVIGMAGAVAGDGSVPFFDQLIAINGPRETLAESMARTASNLERAAQELGIRLREGRK